MFLEESYRTMKMQRYNGMTYFMISYFLILYTERCFLYFSVYTYSVYGVHRKHASKNIRVNRVYRKIIYKKYP